MSRGCNPQWSVLPLCGRVCPTAEVLVCVDKPCVFTLSSAGEWRVTGIALSVGDRGTGQLGTSYTATTKPSPAHLSEPLAVPGINSIKALLCFGTKEL